MFEKFSKKLLRLFIVFNFILVTVMSVNSNNAYAQFLEDPIKEGYTRYLYNHSGIEYIGDWKYKDDKIVYEGPVSYYDEKGEKCFTKWPKEMENPPEIRFKVKGTNFDMFMTAHPVQFVYDLYIDGEWKQIISSGRASLGSAQKPSVKYSGWFTTDADEEHEIRLVLHNHEKYYEDMNYEYSIDAIDVKGELVFDKINEEEDVILDAEPEKEIIKIDEEVLVDLTINNIQEITAEDIRIKYDSDRLEFLGYEEVEGIKLVKDMKNDDELRVILASKGEANIIKAKEVLLKLRFRGEMAGEALVDVTKGRVTDGIEMEKDLEEKDCGKGIILIEEDELVDVNNSGEFTLLDLGIDARHLNKDPKAQELLAYNTDIVEDGSIDDMDLLEIGKLMLENDNYAPNNY